MKKTPLKAVKTGLELELARPVYGLMGEVLLNTGAALKPQYITALLEMGISSVYIKDERLADIDQEDVISEKTRQEAHLLIKNIFTENIKSSDGYRFIYRSQKSIWEVANNIIDDLLENKNIVINVADIKALNNYYFQHSLSVTVISVIACLIYDFPISLIKRYFSGIMLFDIGNTRLPQRLLYKKGAFSEKDYDAIKKHTTHGFRILNKADIFSDNSALIPLQHHERLNGEGYPKKRSCKDINLVSQIVAVADIYDALISDRPYRNALHPFQALEVLSWMGESGLNMNIVKMLYEFISAFPIGLHVVLNNGESGLVIGNKKGYPFQPKVRLFYEGEKYSPLKTPYEEDLSTNKELNVEKVLLDNNELVSVTSAYKPIFIPDV